MNTYSHHATSEKVDERVDELTSIAYKLANSILLDQNVEFHIPRLRAVVHGYFILNDHYHNWRMNNGHPTEDAKICALTTIAIHTLRPFEPKKWDPSQRTKLENGANQLLSIRFAQAITDTALCFGTDDSKEMKNFWLRTFDVFEVCGSETLSKFVADFENGHLENLTQYTSNGKVPNEEKDMPLIDCLVSIYQLLIDRSHQST